MDDKQIRGVINNYVGLYLQSARTRIERADKDGARRVGSELVNFFGKLGESEIIEEVIELARETDWANENSLKIFQRNYTNVMQGTSEDASRY